MNYPGLDDVEFAGKLAVEFATRPDTGSDGWQPRVSQYQRAEIIFEQAWLAAHLANIYLSE